MSVRIYEATGRAGPFDCAVSTDLSQQEAPLFFADQLAAALASALTNVEAAKREALIRAVLRRALPVAFKAHGYKADEVVEKRVVTFGPSAWSDSQVIGQGGDNFASQGGVVEGSQP